MKTNRLVFGLAVLLSVSTAQASIPQDCKPSVVASDTLDLAHAAELPRYLADHIAYMNQRLADGSIVQTGAITDASGNVLEGFTVYNTKDVEVARKTHEGDPFVQAGIVKIQYKFWNLCR